MKRLLATLVLVLAGAAPALADPTDTVKSAFVSLMHATSYHMNVETHGKAMDGDIVPPAKMHITVSPMEMILLDGVTYLKMGGTWRKFTMPGMDRITAPFAAGRDYASHTDKMVVSDLGMKSVDGSSLHAYNVQQSGSSHPITVYIDGALPVRIDDETSGGTSIVRFSKFNAPITITAPI